MNKYIGTVNDNYLFTNRKGIEVNDIIYHYDKKGKKLKEYECYNYKGENIGFKDYKDIDWNEIDIAHPSCYHQGTGRITAQYKVVEVYNLNSTVDNGFIKEYHSSHNTVQEGFAYSNKDYAIKLELIKEVDYALSDFVSWIKFEKALSKWGFAHPNNFKLTRYNGLTKVILKEEL